VAVDGVMQVLLDRSLVRIAGRADLPGRPLLYSTTGYFLEHFGLKSTHDLPNAAELGRLNLPKAAVSEEKAAKQREKDEQEPELPLEMPPDEGGASGNEVAPSVSETSPLDQGEASFSSGEPAAMPEEPAAFVAEESPFEEEASSGLGSVEQASSPSESVGENPPENDFPSYS